jgi:hypothetical protein
LETRDRNRRPRRIKTHNEIEDVLDEDEDWPLITFLILASHLHRTSSLISLLVSFPSLQTRPNNQEKIRLFEWRVWEGKEITRLSLILFFLKTQWKNRKDNRES